MAERLERLSLMLKIQSSKHSLNAEFFAINLSLHPAVNGYLALFRAGEGEGGEEEEWSPTSVTSLPGISWLFNTHFTDGH